MDVPFFEQDYVLETWLDAWLNGTLHQPWFLSDPDEGVCQSRSAAIQHAIRLLADPDLEDAYEAAWQEWEISGEAALWEGAASDGIDDVAR